MVDEPWTRINNTPNKSVRRDVGRRGVVLHHAAMTSLDGLRYLEMGAKEVSSSAIVKDRAKERMMPEDIWRAWSLSDSYWDSALRSVETCNESVDGWTISDESHESLAQVVAWWAQMDGFWPHRDGDPSTWTVIGHREVYTIHGGSYATACPGGMNLDWIARRAQEILTGQVEPEKPKKYGGIMAQRAYYVRVDANGNDNGEWMMAGVDLGPHPTDPKQDGYRVTTDKSEAVLWGRQYSTVGPNDGPLTIRLDRDNYIKQQEFARKDAQEYRQFLRDVLK